MIQRVYRILVVDDLSQIRELVSTFLNSPNYQIIEAQDGLEALTLYRRHHFDAIISDLRMPKMSGVELIKVLRDQGSLIPFVFLTAYADDEKIREVSSFGAYHLLDKFKISQIKVTLEKCLDVGGTSKDLTDDSEGNQEFIKILNNAS